MRTYGSGYGNVPRPTPGTISDGENWRGDAACREVDPELWFPVGTTGPALKQAAAAKAICAGCPSQAACLSWALETGQDHGIWGGLSEQERRNLRRRRVRRGRAAVQASRQPSPEVTARGHHMLRSGWSQIDVAADLHVGKNTVTAWAKQLHEEVDAL